MAYSIAVEEDHVYVSYHGSVDALDMVRLTANQHFIQNLRELQKVVHDFSLCDDVTLGFQDMQELTVLCNLESNFTEKVIGIMIPRTAEGVVKINNFCQSIQSAEWTILAAQDYPSALKLLRVQSSE